MRHYHREANGRRSRPYQHLQGAGAGKRDDTKAWLEAGFEMTDWNKFQLVVKNRTYKIAPGRSPKGEWGIRVTGRPINGEGLWFPANHPPAKIALYLSNLADNPVEVSG